jgi:hypothetical protein
MRPLLSKSTQEQPHDRSGMHFFSITSSMIRQHSWSPAGRAGIGRNDFKEPLWLADTSSE